MIQFLQSINAEVCAGKMVVFIFTLDASTSIEALNLYWKCKMRTKTFAYTILCLIDNEWQVVDRVPQAPHALRETMCPNIYQTLLQIPKDNRLSSDKWKLITTLSNWSVVRYLHGVGYGVTNCTEEGRK